MIVAGGLGERLGYSGIKLALPSETLSGTCYLELYIRHVLALEASAPIDAGGARRQIPVVIMTSDDTDAPTRQLLAANANFGLHAAQLHLVKQSRVPCLSSTDATLATDPSQ